jgi:hypothetical protein
MRLILYLREQLYRYAARIGLCIPILFLFSTVTAIQLKRESTKIAKMNGKAKSDWNTKRKICSLSIIIGLCTFVDHSTWVAHFAAKFQTAAPSDIGKEAIIKHTYEEATENIKRWWIIVITGIIQTTTGQIIHAWRFFIYLSFNMKMVSTLKKVLGCVEKESVASLAVSNQIRSIMINTPV